jgi:predicted nucleic acid-binding Zn finger protein
MRQVTIEKIIFRDRVHYRAVRRVRTFKAGEIVKFNTADGVKIAVVTVGRDIDCRKCVFCNFGNCPKFMANPLHGSYSLCNHHRYMDMDIYFKPIDSVLENL